MIAPSFNPNDPRLSAFANGPIDAMPQAPAGMMFRGFGSMSTQGTPYAPSPLDRGIVDPTTATPGQPEPQAKPSLFGKGGKGWGYVGALGDALLALSGTPGSLAMLQMHQQRQQAQRQQQQQQAEWARQDAQRAEDRGWQVEDRDARLNAPQYFMSGHDRVAFDPATGTTNVVYDGPEDYEGYAATLGLKPTDKGYGDAIRDYVLRGSGPTALAGKAELEGQRQGNRLQLRGTPTYRQTHPLAPRATGAVRGPTTMSGVIAPLLTKMARGQALTPGEQQALSTYQAGRGGGRARGGSSGGAGGGGAVPVVRTPAEARALPRGTRFRTPDGREMVR